MLAVGRCRWLTCVALCSIVTQCFVSLCRSGDSKESAPGYARCGAARKEAENGMSLAWCDVETALFSLLRRAYHCVANVIATVTLGAGRRNGGSGVSGEGCTFGWEDERERR
jgi:hypothetical protein